MSITFFWPGYFSFVLSEIATQHDVVDVAGAAFVCRNAFTHTYAPPATARVARQTMKMVIARFICSLHFGKTVALGSATGGFCLVSSMLCSACAYYMLMRHFVQASPGTFPTNVARMCSTHPFVQCAF